MPVEIGQLTIKGLITQDDKRSEMLSEEEELKIIEKCIERIFDILEREKSR